MKKVEANSAAHLDNLVFWFERKFLTLEYTAGAVFHWSRFWAEKYSFTDNFNFSSNSEAKLRAWKRPMPVPKKHTLVHAVQF